MSDKSRLQERLNESTRVLWRSPHSVQLELGRRSVILDGIDSDTVRELVGHPEPPTRKGAAPQEEPTDNLARVRAELRRLGFLVDDAGGPAPVAALVAEQAALRVRLGTRAGAVVASRRAARVVIRGGGRVAPALGALLAASGVGSVAVTGSGPARLRSILPGGLRAQDEGRDYAQASADAVRRAAPRVRTDPPHPDAHPDLVILCTEGPVDGDVRGLLHETGQAHLVVRHAADHLIVGPLVLPGATSCLRCADLHRTDRDPAWSALAVQLASPARYPPPSDAVLASLTVAVAAMQALAFLDREPPATIEATLELDVPDWRMRRRTWPVHPDCPCAAAA